MLTKDQIKFRRRGNNVSPTFINPNSVPFLELAEELLAIYRSALDESMTREEISELVESTVRGGVDLALGRAFDKLILDRCRFSPASDFDYPEKRKELFAYSGQLLVKNKHSSYDDYRTKLEEKFSDFLSRDIYGDLPDNEIIIHMRDFSPLELTHRYNVAQVQGLLMDTEELHIVVSDPNPAEIRRLFKYLKFFRLLARIKKGKTKNTLKIDISGPFTLFANTRMYAVQLASFFPALIMVEKWKLEANLKINKRAVKLSLDEKSELRSHYRNFSAYVPEEVSMFHQLFREKVEDWKIVGEAPFIDTGGGQVIFPDLSFSNKKGKTIHLELFHRWHKTELERRIAFLQKKPKTPLIIGIDRSLMDNKDHEAMEKEYPNLIGRSFLFRDFPGVTRVNTILNNLVEKN